MAIILTGATGFLGNIIKHTLIGHEIITVGRKHSDINVDLFTSVPELPAVNTIIHAAGKAHVVPKTPAERHAFFEVNVIGTKNLLAAIEKFHTLPESFVFISTIAVYGLETGELIKEDTPLLANDPYGKSKIEAEALVQQWCNQHGVICTILRLPLIVGPNPPGNLQSMINGITKGYYFNISGGTAKKSMVLAEDVAKIIPVTFNIGGVYHLTDRYHPSFSELAENIAKQVDKSKPANIPAWFATIAGKIGDLLGKKAPLNTNKLKKITSSLTFDDAKAVQLLGWQPTPVLKGFKIN